MLKHQYQVFHLTLKNLSLKGLNNLIFNFPLFSCIFCLEHILSVEFFHPLKCEDNYIEKLKLKFIIKELNQIFIILNKN